MTENTQFPPNTLFIEITGAGLPEVDGLYIPSKAPPQKSESGTLSSPGYWNDRMAWDRADGKAARSPALSYSNSYKSWRISRLDGHLAYEITCDDELPPTDTNRREPPKRSTRGPAATRPTICPSANSTIPDATSSVLQPLASASGI